MLIFALALISLGGLVFAISGVWTLALAFQRHVLWGLAVLLVPFGGNVAFLCVSWREARLPFFLGMASLLLMGSAVFSMPKESLRVPFHSAVAFVQQDQRLQSEIAEQTMLDERREAELQIHLLSLKRQEDALRLRKLNLDANDQASAQRLSNEIRHYNAKLQPLLAQLKTER